MKLENPSPYLILPGILPKSAGIWNSFIFFWIDFRSSCSSTFSFTYSFFTIHLAIPKKRQYMGSITTNRIGSKYGNRNSLDHLTLVFLMNLVLLALDLYRLQSRAF